MKKRSKKTKLLWIIPVIILVCVCISILLIHNYNNRFRYEIYSNGEMDYQFMDKGYYYEDLGGGVYHYVITSGEKSTGGYSIDIKSVTKEGDTVKVLVYETKPDGIATTALTYPYVILELYEKPSNIEIKDVEGNTFDRFN